MSVEPSGFVPHPLLINEPGPDPIRPGHDSVSDHSGFEEFQIIDRWFSTATNGAGLSQGDATTLTWSFADDGTHVPGFNGEPDANSNLIAVLDSLRGAGPGGSNLTQRPWFSLFADSFARLSALSGNTYVYEPNDDGAAFSDDPNATPGVLATRGDIRIGGHFIDGESGDNVLAYNFFPDVGEMVIDVGNVSFLGDTTGNNLALRNMVMHEHGHGLGIRHVESSDAAFLMEPFLNTSFDGPQLDDVRALHRNYGDALEKAGGNNSLVTATNLGTINIGQTVSRGKLGNSTVVAAAATDFVSIDDESDIDFFKFTVSANTAVSLTLSPRGATYQQGPQGGAQGSFNAAAQNDLTLQLLGANGTTVLQTVNATGLGGSETIANFTLAAGTYFIRVSGATADAVQLYGLDVSVATPGDATPASQRIIAGPGAGQPEVRVFDAAGQLQTAFQPYPGFLGEVRVAAGDVNGDGTADILTAVGSALGVGPHVKVFNGINGAELFSFYAYDFNFNGGVFIAAGDVNLDGRADIITGADAGAGPHVKVFSGADGGEISSFYAYDQGFNGGVRVAAGDVNNDGRADIITGAGPGAGPHVKAFSGLNGSELASYYAYDQGFAGGVYVASGDVNDDGRDDIITGAGPSAGPHVKAFDGASQVELFSFYAFHEEFSGGVRVAAGDLNSDGRADIIAAAGFGGGPHVRAFNGTNGTELASFYAYPITFSGGVFVAGVTTESSALRLADAPGATIATDSLTIDPLQMIHAAAINRFADAGLGHSGLDLLRSVRVSLADLPGDLLGLARGESVLIDRDAAGRGWFIDPTPDTDEEFSFVEEGQAIASGAAASVDLLTAVLHELGHVLGLEHDHGVVGSDELMFEELRTGVRRLPTQQLIDAALASW